MRIEKFLNGTSHEKGMDFYELWFVVVLIAYILRKKYKNNSRVRSKIFVKTPFL